MTTINSVSSFPSFRRVGDDEAGQKRSKAHDDATSKSMDSISQEELGPEISIRDRTLEMADDQSMAMFRRRREFEKRHELLHDLNFDEVLDDNAKEKSSNLLAALRVSKNQTVEQIVKIARGLFPDISDLLVVIRQLLRLTSLSRKERAVLEELQEEILASAESEGGLKEVKLKRNVALKARLFGQKNNLSPAIVRNIYSDFIVSTDDEIHIYRDWALLFDLSKRHIIIKFIRSALIADMNANDPSCSFMEYLKSLNRLSKMMVIRSVDEIFFEAIAAESALKALFSKQEKGMMLLLATISEPETIESNLDEIINEHDQRLSWKDKTSIAQYLLNIFSVLPLEIYKSKGDRHVIMQGFKEIIGKWFVYEKQDMIANNKNSE